MRRLHRTNSENPVSDKLTVSAYWKNNTYVSDSNVTASKKFLKMTSDSTVGVWKHAAGFRWLADARPIATFAASWRRSSETEIAQPGFFFWPSDRGLPVVTPAITLTSDIHGLQCTMQLVGFLHDCLLCWWHLDLAPLWKPYTKILKWTFPQIIVDENKIAKLTLRKVVKATGWVATGVGVM